MITIDGAATATLSGRGEVEIQLREGPHAFELRYDQRAGPAAFALGWDPPGMVDAPLSRYLSRSTRSSGSGRFERVRASAVGAFVLGAVWWWLALSLVLRAAARAWVGRTTSWAVAAPTVCAFLVEIVWRTPDVSGSWLALATGILVLGVGRASRRTWPVEMARRFDVVVAAGLVLTVMLTYHLGELNGPWYWKWVWRSLEPTRLHVAMLAALVPFFLAQLIRNQRPRWPTSLVLALFMLSVTGLHVAKYGGNVEPALAATAHRISHPVVTSYFTDAGSLIDSEGWLTRYPDLLETFHTHSRNKPPGPALYFAWFRSWIDNPTSAAVASGVALSILAVFAIPMAYCLSLVMTGDPPSAFAGSSLAVLLPGFIFFAPGLDPAMATLTCLLVGSWALAWRYDRWTWAVGFGAALAFCLFVSYSFLVLSFFLLGYAAIDSRPWLELVRRGAAKASVAGATLGIVYGLLWAELGFDAARTFHRAIRVQGEMLTRTPGLIRKPYGST